MRRDQKAVQLLELLGHGPSLDDIGGGFDALVAERQVQLWIRSWVTPVVKDLLGRDLREAARRAARRAGGVQ